MNKNFKNPNHTGRKNTPERSFSNKRKFNQNEAPDFCYRKKFKKNGDYKTENDMYDQQKNISSSKKSKDVAVTDSGIQESIIYYEKILQVLKQGVDPETRDSFICNVLRESENKEVELCCHNVSSHCIELLLNDCKSDSIIKRFMTAFAEQKIPVCTSGNATHITELLIYYAVQAIQDWPVVMSSEDGEEKKFVTYCIIWLTEFGEFALENFKDCLSNPYSCHVVCSLIRALSGDISKENKFMSKNLKVHKQEFHSRYNEKNSGKEDNKQISVTLEQIPKFFSTTLKKLYKSFLKLENLFDYATDSSSATVIEALLSALKKRLPKSCKKMIMKTAQNLFSEKNNNGVPLSLLHKNCSYVVDEMFKAADEDLQLHLWNEYIVDSLGKLITHVVGNFVIQRIYDAIKNRSHFEIICEATWCLFSEILRSENFGIFVSMATACIRMKSQQPLFMKNIMQCLQCFEPEDRQDLVIPLLLGFQTYDEYMSSRKSSQTIVVCLQGSLVAQAVLKFQKPLKVIKSMLSMPPTDLEYLTGHMQGCHVLNAFFSSVSVGEKNKEQLLYHLKPVIVSIACDRNKSLTLSRIWVLLSLKLKEVLVKELVQNEETLQLNQNGNLILKKCGIFHFRRHYNNWKEIQSKLTSKTKS